MENTEGRTLTMSRTACKIAAKEGWTPEEIQETFNNPKAVYAVKEEKYAGQYRIAGTKVCLVGVPIGEDRFHAITAIVNGSKAPVK